uniref:Uncharacterized protein n=1 Tax=Polytomella parva TaxID=51329 RepID=A0A7S0UMM7_9CHLO
MVFVKLIPSEDKVQVKFFYENSKPLSSDEATENQTTIEVAQDVLKLENEPEQHDQSVGDDKIAQVAIPPEEDKCESVSIIPVVEEKMVIAKEKNSKDDSKLVNLHLKITENDYIKVVISEINEVADVKKAEEQPPVAAKPKVKAMDRFLKKLKDLFK